MPTLTRLWSVFLDLTYTHFGAAVIDPLQASANRVAIGVGLCFFVVVWGVRIAQLFRASRIIDAAHETFFFIVFVPSLAGMYARTFSPGNNFVLVIALFFFLPSFPLRRNRRLAFLFGLLVDVFALPIILRVVIDPAPVALLTGACVLCVLCLWMFCSEVFTFLSD
jgi:hypothetical protein